jgi:hypothetical protein
VFAVIPSLDARMEHSPPADAVLPSLLQEATAMREIEAICEAINIAVYVLIFASGFFFGILTVMVML